MDETKETKPEVICLDDFEEAIISCACKAGDDVPWKK